LPTRQTFTESIEAFLTAADEWLTDEDAPAVAALCAMAEQLDREMTPALLAQYGLSYRTLLKRKPANAGAPEDELELLLRDG